MLNFFSKRNKVTDISWLGVDIHSHILPGIDDGSPDVETSTRFVKKMGELGFSYLIATPHIFKELYPNNRQTIAEALASVKANLTQNNVGVQLDAGAEYMLDQDFDLEGDLCSLPHKNILIEMSYMSENPNISQIIFDLQIKNLRPILAHPERYTYYFKDLTRIKRFKEKGCLMQLNLLSILGYYGKDVKILAEMLLKENLYDLAGTDLHHDKHLHALSQGIESGKLYDEIGKYEFKNKEIFTTSGF